VLAVVALTSSGEGDGARDRRILRAVLLLAQQEALARQAAEYSRR
jgi:hypothetical protein